MPTYMTILTFYLTRKIIDNDHKLKNNQFNPNHNTQLQPHKNKTNKGGIRPHLTIVLRQVPRAATIKLRQA